jgi:hypothetical protein
MTSLGNNDGDKNSEGDNDTDDAPEDEAADDDDGPPLEGGDYEDNFGSEECCYRRSKSATRGD